MIKLDRLTLPLNAPQGAAAYAVQLDAGKKTATVVFGMMAPGERGDQAYCRIKQEATQFTNWAPVASRPENQQPVGGNSPPYVGYDFAYVDDKWQAGNADLANFLRASSTFNAMPQTPPASLAYRASGKDTTTKARKQ